MKGLLVFMTAALALIASGCAADTPSATDLPECSSGAAVTCLSFEAGELVVVDEFDGRRFTVPASEWPPVEEDIGPCDYGPGGPVEC